MDEGEEQAELDDGVVDDTPPLPDMPVYECRHDLDPERYDCADGQKCMPHGAELQENGCFPLAEMPIAIGEPCEDDDSLDGVDPCVAGTICWGGDGDQFCTPFCTFSDEEYTCPSGDQTCTVSGSFGHRVCLDNCDPLNSDCADGVCHYAGWGFFCTPGGELQQGEACSKDYECGAGLACAPQSGILGCEAGCCTPYCTTDGAPCPEAASGQECLLVHEEAPEAFSDVGVCTWPA